MSDFVLVHGAFHGGWCWDAVAALLQAAGHRVHAPTLSSATAAQSPNGGKVTMSDLVDEVVNVIESGDLHDVVLVGHSLGGMIVTAVADRCRERIARLVYLDAFVPVTDQSVRDLAPAAMRAQVLDAVHTHGRGQFVPVVFPAAKFVDFGATQASAFMARLTPQPFLTFAEPILLRHPPIGRRVFIYCAGVPFGLFDSFAATARESADWVYHELQTPHDAMIVAPREVAGILLAEAKSEV